MRHDNLLLLLGAERRGPVEEKQLWLITQFYERVRSGRGPTCGFECVFAHTHVHVCVATMGVSAVGEAKVETAAAPCRALWETS